MVNKSRIGIDNSQISLFIAIFLVGIGFSIIMPVLPYYAESLGATAFQLGLLITVYALCQFIFAPIWGSYSDKVGRKPLVLLGLVGFAITFILFALATSLWMLFAARIAGGILSCATMPAAMAYIGDSTTPEQRGTSMGLIGASMGMGMIFGPAIGGVLSNISLAFPFFIAGSLAAINGVAVFIFMQESLPVEKRAAEVKVSRAPLLQGLKTPMAILFVITLLVSIGESTHHGTFALFAEARLGFGAADIGWTFTCAGVVSVIVQGLIVGRLINHLGEEKTVSMGIANMILSYVLFLQAASLVGIMVCMAVFALGTGLIRPSISAAVSRRTTMQQGISMGIMQGYDSLGRAIGPALGGFLLDVSINYAYYMAIIVLTVAIVILVLKKFSGEKLSSIDN
ncbi:MAG: MFS transporter [Syntrophomonadaceae bacterium]|nr:MFS transporter [Syntrophomonadaceae bacterium]MDD3888555.1 MFS transporter [Syntrophomonadaceae bacterium]MDD4548603.1 MFS transporter [Syntrophomonadaceae bacterium]